MGLARGDQGARRRRCRDIDDDERHRDRPQPPSARRVATGRHRFLCRSSSTIHIGIASSSLRELNAVALATNVTVLMERGTKPAALLEPTRAVRDVGFSPRASAANPGAGPDGEGPPRSAVFLHPILESETAPVSACPSDPEQHRSQKRYWFANADR